MKRYLLLIIVLIMGISVPKTVLSAPRQAISINLDGYWKMDEATAGIRQSIVHSPTMDAQQVDGLPAAPIEGVIGNGVTLSWPESGEHFYIPNSVYSSVYGHSYTVAGWFRMRSLPGDSNWSLIEKTNEFRLLFQGYGQNRFYFDSGGGVVTSSDIAVEPGEWYFVAAWYDEATEKNYLRVNDHDPWSVPAAGASSSSNSLGLGGGANYRFAGDMDEIGLWGRALSTDEIDQLYNNGYGCSYPFTNCDGSAFNLIRDGGMEQVGGSSYWYPDTSSSPDRTEFGRINVTNIWTQIAHGSAACEQGMQLIGNVPNWIPGTGIRYRYADVSQTFYLPEARTVNYYFLARARPSAPGETISIRAYILNRDTAESTMLENPAVIADDGEWHTYRGGVELGGGRYRLTINLADGSDELDRTYIDAVTLSTEEIEDVLCPGVVPAATATPTINLTPSPGANTIDNCGFGMGEDGWVLHSGANIVYGSDNYLNIASGASSPGAIKTFTWSGGPLYVSFRTDANYDVKVENIATGQITTILSGLHSLVGWVTYRVPSANLSAGAYELQLHYPTGAGPAHYDDITINTGSYGMCNGSDTNITITPTTTRTPTRTLTITPGGPTITRTNTPTPVVQIVTPTYSPTPTTTRTPYGQPQPPTLTPVPPTITNTPIPPTVTAGGPSTETPTITPVPATVTSAPTWTPAAPWNGGDLPPALGEPGNNAPAEDCNHPANAISVVGWIDYERCLMQSGTSWQPRHSETLQAIPTMFADREPIRSVGQIRDGLEESAGMVQTALAASTPYAGGDVFDPGDYTTEEGECSLWDGCVPEWGPDLITEQDPWSFTCKAVVDGVWGKYLAEGWCFVLSLLRNQGVLILMQIVVDIAFVWGAIKATMMTLRFKWAEGRGRNNPPAAAKEE